MAQEIIVKGDRTDSLGTPIPQSLIARVVEGVRYVVTGAPPDAWFGPGQPLQPVAQAQAEGRLFDYPVAYNVRIQPREGEAVTFPQLRALADSYDLLRLVIETRKDQIVKMDWTIQLKDQHAKPTEEQQRRIDDLLNFFAYPDQQRGWETWLRALLEDMLVIDAACVYPRRNKGGGIYGFELMDGATIKRLLNEDGRTPLPPDPAYQQILKGIPAVDYSLDELVYVPRNERTWKVYGYSQVEQIIMTVNIAVRRQIHQLQFYTEGNIPEALVGVPTAWTPDQIKAFQTYWDAIMEGNTAMRRHARFIPGDIAKNYIPTKDENLKDEYDEWLARIVCFAFSISPNSLVKQQNRATADTQRQEAKEEGLFPIMAWVKNTINLLLHKYLQQDDLQFAWRDDEKVDPLSQAQINQIYLQEGVKSPDDVRQEIGMDPLPGPLRPAEVQPAGAAAKLAKAQKKSLHRY